MIGENVLSLLDFPEITQDDAHPLEDVSDKVQIQIISACAENPIIFALMCRVPSAEGFVKLKLYPKQENIINSYLEEHYVIILGSRQTGKTTVTYTFIIWLLIFHGNYKVGLLMQNDTSVKGSIKEIYDIYNLLPTWLQEVCVVDNTKEKVYSNGSKLLGFAVDPKNPDGIGRSMKVDFLLIDEGAFITNVDKAYRALKPVTSRRHLRLKNNDLPYGTVIISTPNGTFGTGKWYYNFWSDALKNINKFKAIKFHWSEVPEYDEEWYKDATNDMNERDINQEYELKFLGSKSSYFEDSIIENIQNKDNMKPVIDTIKLKHGTVELYEEIKDDTIYIIGADSADAGDDYAAMVIFDYFANKPVGTYYDDNVAAIDFAYDTYELCLKIPNSLLIFEKNSIGTTSVQMLYQELGPNRIWVVKDKRWNPDSYKSAGMATATHSRRLMFDALYKYVKENPEKLTASILIYELISLEKKGNRIEAAKGAHDDLVLSLCFILYIIHYGNIEEYISRFNILGEDGAQSEFYDSMVKEDTIISQKVDDAYENPLLNIIKDNDTAYNNIMNNISSNANQSNSSEWLDDIFKIN